MKMSFGQRLKEARKKAKKTQDQVAKFLGLDYSTISKYENNHSQPDNETLARLAEIYDVKVDYLITGRTEELRSTNEEYDYTKDPSVTDELRELLDILNSMPPDEKADIIQQALTYAAGKKMRNRSTQD